MNLSLPYAWSVWRRNATLYLRTWQWNLLPNFFEPVLYLTAIGIGLGAYVSRMDGQTYIEFLAPALVCVAAMNGASFEVTYNMFVRLNMRRTYDAMLTTPLSPDDVLAGEMLWALTRVCLYGGGFFAVAALFGLAPLPRSLAAVPLIPLTGLLFAAIGIVFTLHIVNIDLYSFYFTLFVTPLFLFSGVFFPLEERLPAGWLWLAEALPLLHPVRLARAIFTGRLGWIAVWDLAYIALVTPLLLGWALRKARRRLIA